jgi:hypothetical protein
MSIEIILLLFITVLLGYIVFLHVRLTKRNIFIESAVRRLSGIEKSRSMDEMMAYLQEILNHSPYSSFLKNRILKDSTIDFILENEKDFKIFLHYTKKEEDAKSILENGFKFVDSFYKTAVHVTKDKLDLVIKHNSRKYYGDYLILICISNDIVNFYSGELEKAGIMEHSFENILAEIPPWRNENSDLVYLLPNKFIKAYINYRSANVVKNQQFDPYYNSDLFMKNIYRLKTR